MNHTAEPKMFRRLHWLPVIAACAFSQPSRADADHDRISSERAAANAKFAAQDKECRTRFIVASCVEAAKKEQQLSLSRLRQEELRLDDAKRREAAAARRQSVQDKEGAQQSRASEPVPEPFRSHVRQPPSPNPTGSMAPHATGETSSPAERAAFERSHEAAFEAKSREIEAHREEVERRNAQRSAQGKVAAPLPAAGPSAASAALPAASPPAPR